MHKLEERINVKWENGSSTAWVNELEQGECEGSDFEYFDESDVESSSSDENGCAMNTSGAEEETNIDMLREAGTDDQNNTLRVEIETENDEERVESESHHDTMGVVEYLGGTPITSRVDRPSQQEECMVTPQPRKEVQRVMGNSIPSVDDWWGGPVSCPVQAKEVDWFDPIATIEAPMSQGNSVTGGLHMSIAANQGRRPKGRPRRVACSLPDTLSVPSTPILDSSEANNTWQMATKLGIGCRSVSAVHEELRRSKRIQVLEYSTPAPSR
ncbi:unnamed protein product [Amaranthus hypochondriacus]